jgi:GT2 family glycosyltransferase
MISVIIPTYCPVVEVDQKLWTCLRTIINCTDLKDVELVIVEQGRYVAGVQLAGILPQIENLVYYSTIEPLGFSGAVNKGVALSSGDYLLIINNDIEVSRDWATKLVNAYKKTPKAGMLFPALTDPKNCMEMIETPWSWWSCVCISREVWNDVGPLDSEKLKFRLHDQDWSIRAFNKGYVVGCYRGVTVKHDDMSTYKHMTVDEAPERAAMIERWGFEHFSDYTNSLGKPITEIRL